MSILVPLYLWPGDGAWEPLYSTVEAHHSVNFTVIVNPNSGPGSGELPDEAFLAGVPKLNSYNNVRTIGYVKTGWALNDIESVLAEISTYAAWAEKAHNPELGLDGIFFDEAPSEYDAIKYDYMDTIGQKVKEEAGLGDKIVVHNPGTVSAYKDLSDVSVEFEKSYDEWKADPLQANSTSASKTAVIMYSLPESEVDSVVPQVEQAAKWLFLTSDNQADGYLQFSSIFANVVASLDDV